MNPLKLTLTILVLLVAQHTLFANGTLKGHVFDKKTGEPIFSATISYASGFGTTTDFDGNYSLSLPAGQHQIQYSFVGYYDTVYVVSIEEGKEHIINHGFTASAIQLNITTVVGGKYTKGGGKHRKSYAPSYQPPVAHNTSNYRHVDENNFKDPKKEPLSTLSIDVDKASYANIRRHLMAGTLPPQDAVRVEEMINYFSYEYPQPTDGHPFSITMEANACPWNPNHQLVLVGIQGKDIALEEAPPSNLVFLIDVSGSMASSDKLGLVVSGFKLLVNELRPEDYVTLVVYAGSEGLVLPPTPGTDKETILAALDGLSAGGGTAGGAGIKLAYKMAREHFIKDGNNRVILATDGDFNVGVSSDGALQRLIEEERESGVFLSVLGVGMGNYMDGRMNMLAEKGNGECYYLDNLMEAHKVFVQELRGTLFTIAKDVKIQVEFNPAQVKSYRLIGYETRLLENEDFNDDKKDAGEIGSGHSVTALYEIVPANSKEAIAGNVDALKYQESTETSASQSGELFTIKFRYKQPTGKESTLITRTLMAGGSVTPSQNFKFASAVAAFGMLLLDSKHKGSANYKMVQDLAQQGLGNDPFGYRGEFVRLVGVAASLAPKNSKSENR